MRSRYAGLALTLVALLMSGGPRIAAAQGDIRFEQYSPQEERHWQGVLRREPRNAQAAYYLGRYYEFTKRLPEAVASYQRATEYKPAWAQAWFALGKAYREVGRYPEAITALKRAVTLKSNFARAYHYLGLLQLGQGRYEEAGAAFLQAYTHDPGWAETYYDNTTYGIHNELGDDKDGVLRVIRFVYPVNQHLARIMYNRWARGHAGMKEYWETVSGATLPADKGYQQAPLTGYLEPEEAGYQKAPDPGFQRRPNQPSAPHEVAD